MKNIQKILACYLIGVNFCGCARMSGSLIAGAGTGAVLGTAAGVGFSNDKGSGAWQGALIGAGVGLISSYFIHNGIEKRDADVRRDTLLNLERFGVEGIPSEPLMYPDPYGISTQDEARAVIQAHK
ncbi:MAG: hypothetical protein JWQ35_2678, partial [Bacteriovoracaceae bacterium]|nr:hypothetical protein [Bacteriovoracaceae bacterium]